MADPLQILIVEDIIDISRELKEYLRDLPSDPVITISPSAEEGILEMGRHGVDLLVTDFRLPGISGLELVRRVRKKYPKVKVILTSAVLDAQFKQEAENLNVEHVLQKPVEPKTFRQSVAHSLGIEAGNLPEPVKSPAPPAKPEPPEIKKEKGEDASSKTILKIHQVLGAKCTLWMTSEGEVEKAFGDLPPELPRDVIRNCARSVSSMHQSLAKMVLAPQMGSIHYQAGMSVDLLICSVEEWVLLGLFQGGIDPQELEKKIGLLQASTGEIMKVVRAEPGPGHPAPQPGMKKGEGVDPGLEKLLGTTGKVSSREADDFWEEVSASAKPDLGNPDLLNYEQAKKMGFKIKRDDKPG
jgi:CheY-like chemotaxis protein